MAGQDGDRGCRETERRTDRMIGIQQLEGNTRAAVLLLVVIAIALCGAMLADKLSLGIAVASVLPSSFSPSALSAPRSPCTCSFFHAPGAPAVRRGRDEVMRDRGRGVALRADDILIATIGLSWFLRVAINKDLGFFLRTPLNVPIAVYFIICIVATVHGYYLMNPLNPMVGFFFILKYFEYFLVYFMAVNHLREKEQIRRFLIAMLWSVSCSASLPSPRSPTWSASPHPSKARRGSPTRWGAISCSCSPWSSASS